MGRQVIYSRSHVTWTDLEYQYIDVLVHNPIITIWKGMQTVYIVITNNIVTVEYNYCSNIEQLFKALWSILTSRKEAFI